VRIILAVGMAAMLVPFAVAEPDRPANERKEQQQAVEAIVKLGGAVYYDYQRLPNAGRPNAFDPKAKPKDPEAFHRVISVGLRDTNIKDDDLKVLTKLSHLEILDLSNTRITGAGLAHLKGLKNLRVLSLWKTDVDDQGLEHLKGMTKMWSLVLDETKITDAGLVHLKDMTDLEEWLGLTGTQITDEGLKHLEGFKKLRHVNLIRTNVTGAGVAKLQQALPNTMLSIRP
jgi:Leucine Rich Repeat (LRR) protein